METVWQDLKYGARQLARNPGFTAIAVLTLALGIGANTAIFSVVNAVLLRPLPFKEPDRLVRLWETNPERNWLFFSASAPNFNDWATQNQTFESLAALEFATFNLTGDAEPERLLARRTTASLFPLLGIEPTLGRNFHPEEDRPGADRVAILSHGLWQRRFGSDPKIIGQTIQLSDEPYEIVGVLPAEFQFTQGTEVWVPLAIDWTEGGRAERSNHTLLVVGRLKPGTSLAQAQADLETIAHRLAQQYPQSNAGWGVRTATFYEWFLPDEVRLGVWVLLGAVGFVLLIACANVANLLLARLPGRRQELAVRAALGAGQGRVLRQLMTESAILAVLGCACGVLLAAWSADAIASIASIPVPRLDETRLDGRVLLFTFTLCFLTTMVFGLIPALQASRANLNSALRESGRGTTGARQRLRSAFVVAEVSLALILLVGAGLMVRSLLHLQRVELGFSPERVLTLRVALPNARYPDGNQRVAFFRDLLQRIRSVPGVQGAAATSGVPLDDWNWGQEVHLEGREGQQGLPSADVAAVTPDYFRTMDIPVLHGRDFSAEDGVPNAPLAVIVNQTFARRFFPGQDAIGKRFRTSPTIPFRNIVGVVGDTRGGSLQDEPRPTFYYCFCNLGFSSLALVVRTSGPPETLVSALRGQVNALDPDLPIYNTRTLESIVDDAAGQPRFQAVLLAVFAGLALLLACIGLYGVMAYAVSQRTHEIGLRLALGARPRDVFSLVLGQGARLMALGLGLGLAGALALTRVLSSLLFAVTPTDGTTFAGVSLLLAGVAVVACWLPARRAMRVDPMRALRYE